MKNTTKITYITKDILDKITGMPASFILSRYDKKKNKERKTHTRECIYFKTKNETISKSFNNTLSGNIKYIIEIITLIIPKTKNGMPKKLFMSINYYLKSHQSCTQLFLLLNQTGQAHLFETV